MNDDHDRLLALLLALGEAIRDRVVTERDASPGAGVLAAVAGISSADTIYHVDTFAEDAVRDWLAAHWPAELPVEVVMEGLAEDGPLTVPAGIPVQATAWKCIIDPIDGTRELMYDKRSAWALAAVAPQRGPRTRLGDLVVATMTELPTTKARRSDQVGAIRGRGAAGLVARTHDAVTGAVQPCTVRPSTAQDFRHGWASFVRFFPEGKSLTAQLEEELWRRLYGREPPGQLAIFDDQYLSTGGQLYELLSGRDRMVVDVRPLVLPRVGCRASLTCHPYDICAALILEAAGGVVEDPRGTPLAAPLDTTTPVAWIGFANPALAALVRPHLQEILRAHALG